MARREKQNCLNVFLRSIYTTRKVKEIFHARHLAAIIDAEVAKTDSNFCNVSTFLDRPTFVFKICRYEISLIAWQGARYRKMKINFDRARKKSSHFICKIVISYISFFRSHKNTKRRCCEWLPR